jgi:general secretion pathway protein B
MSYILDALKKSDQQRQRGTTPTLPSAQATVSAPKQSSYVHYGVLAAVLLCAGIAIGWLYPWQEEQPARAAEPIAAKPATPDTNQASLTPRPDQVAMAETPEQKLPTPSPAPAAPVIAPKEPVIPVAAEQEQKLPVQSPAPAAPVISPKEPAIPIAAEQKATTLSELPVAIQQELPAMKIQLHSYSNKSVNSIVSINSRMMKEGESLAPGLRLEQITPDGVILSYKGYRFQHGIW